MYFRYLVIISPWKRLELVEIVSVVLEKMKMWKDHDNDNNNNDNYNDIMDNGQILIIAKKLNWL